MPFLFFHLDCDRGFNIFQAADETRAQLVADAPSVAILSPAVGAVCSSAIKS